LDDLIWPYSISRLIANNPELAGIRAGIQSLQAIGRTSGVVSALKTRRCFGSCSAATDSNCPRTPL
jgi:hypothetical protein